MASPDAVSAAARTECARIRIVSFNTVEAIHATTVRNELVGRGDGRPGQRYSLANRNVLEGSLVLATQEDSVPTTPLVSWSEVESLDGRGPFESVYKIDREAGRLIFGDGADPDVRIGKGGRIPPLVPDGGEIVALRVPARRRQGRRGSGRFDYVAGDAGPGRLRWSISSPRRAAATRDAGGSEAPGAKGALHRQPRGHEIDFELFALQTPGVRVARASVVPLRRPMPAGSPAPTPPSSPRCKPNLAPGATGLGGGVAAGAVTVVVVPDDPGPEPIPTPSFLRAVCAQLDKFRLVTTEVHVVSPQYCRICRVLIKVRALPGYTRDRLQTLIEERLGTYLHVLRGGEEGADFPSARNCTSRI